MCMCVWDLKGFYDFVMKFVRCKFDVASGCYSSIAQYQEPRPFSARFCRVDDDDDVQWPPPRLSAKSPGEHVACLAT